MTSDAFDPDALANAMAPLLGLTLVDEMRPGIRLNLETMAAMARVMESCILPDDAEPAPVFRPAPVARP